MTVVLIPNDGVTVVPFDIPLLGTVFSFLQPGYLNATAINWNISITTPPNPTVIYQKYEAFHSDGIGILATTPPVYTPTPKIFELSPTRSLTEAVINCLGVAYPGLAPGVYTPGAAVYRTFVLDGATRWTIDEAGTSVLIQVTDHAATSPPATPTGLYAATQCQGGQLTVYWTPGTSPDAGAPDHYNIYVNGTLAYSTPDATMNSYVIPGLTIGLSYIIRVSAVNTWGESALSTSILATPCPVPPSPPHGCYSREADCDSTYTRETIPVSGYTRQTVDCACDD